MYEMVINSYAVCVKEKYDTCSAIGVFDGNDGYDEGPTTKDAAHFRRTGYRMGPTGNFTLNMVLKYKKEEFLSTI